MRCGLGVDVHRSTLTIIDPIGLQIGQLVFDHRALIERRSMSILQHHFHMSLAHHVTCFVAFNGLLHANEEANASRHEKVETTRHDRRELVRVVKLKHQDGEND